MYLHASISCSPPRHFLPFIACRRTKYGISIAAIRWTSYSITDAGLLTVSKLSSQVGPGVAPQVVVKSGCWQAANLSEGGRFALLGCTVAPAFDFEDYEHGMREQLLERFPQHRDEIMKLTRGE